MQRTQLCDVCSRLPFGSRDSLFSTNYAGLGYFILGRLTQLRDYIAFRHCSLCSFIVSTVDELEFQEDGTVILSRHLDSASKPCLSFDLEDPVRGFSKIRLLGPNSVGHNSARPISGHCINTAMISGWLDACEKYHGEKCKPSLVIASVGSNARVPVRFIDVIHECIVDAPSSCRYIALSYVWGCIPMLKLTSRNRQVLAQVGSIKEASNWSRIPQTIRDAITLVQKLSLRYLWVDSLCLIQDDDKDLQHGIESMDHIYEKSHATIIASAGSHAHFGLPGITDESRVGSQRAVEVSPGLRLTRVRSLGDQLKHSEYARRAWT